MITINRRLKQTLHTTNRIVEYTPKPRKTSSSYQNNFNDTISKIQKLRSPDKIALKTTNTTKTIIKKQLAYPINRTDNIKLLGYLESVGNSFKSWSLKKQNKNIKTEPKRGIIHFFIFSKNFGLIRRRREVLFDDETINNLASDRINQHKYGMISFKDMLKDQGNSLFLFHGEYSNTDSNKFKISSIVNPKTKFDLMKNRSHLKIDQSIQEIWDVSKGFLPKDNEVLVNSFTEKRKDRQLLMNYFNVNSMSDDVSRFVRYSVDFAKIQWGSVENVDGNIGINNSQKIAKFRYLQFKNNLVNGGNNDQAFKVEVLSDVKWCDNASFEVELRPRLINSEIHSKFITTNSYKNGITSNNVIILSEADYCQVKSKYSFLALMKLSAPLIVQVETSNRGLVKSMFVGKILKIRGVFENSRDSHVKFKISDSV